MGSEMCIRDSFTGVDVNTEDAIVKLLRSLRDEGRVMLVSTHNLGSVPEFCDLTVLLNRTVLAYGPTVEIFTQANLEKTFGGVLRHFVLNEGESGRPRALDVITDDERAVIFQDGQATRRKSSSGEEGS